MKIAIVMKIWAKHKSPPSAPHDLHARKDIIF
jgi:hypothetical protein